MTAREFATQRLPDHLEADEVAAIIRADELRAIAPGRHILNHTLRRSPLGGDGRGPVLRDLQG